jgi:hypothetical protein
MRGFQDAFEAWTDNNGDKKIKAAIVCNPCESR